MITLDTETDLISPGLLAPPLACVQFAIDDGPVAVAVVGVDPVEELLDTILDHDLCGHNVAYDLLVIARQYPKLNAKVLKAYRESRVTDTILREKLKRIDNDSLWKVRSFSLQEVAKSYGFTKDSNDPWRLRYSELRGVPFVQWPEEAKRYAAHDVEVTRDVYKSQPSSPDEHRQARAAYFLHVIGANGVHTDPEAVAAFEEIVQAQYMKDRMALAKGGLVKIDGSRSTKAAQGLMMRTLEAAGLEVPRTKTGQVSLDEDACDLAATPLLSAYQRYGSHQSLMTRLQGLKHPIINPRFNSLVETGRTSCSQGSESSPTHTYQIQNMRRVEGERECFVPAPGNVFVACDYDAFELAALAQVCIDTVGHSELAEAIRRDLDPHLAMAAKALREPYEDLVKIKKDSTHPRHKAIKEARQGSKIANFGYPGGMGARSFVAYARSYGLTLDFDQAEELKASWHGAWPEMRAYLDFISKHKFVKVRRGDKSIDVTTVTQLRSDRVRGGVTYTAACNSLFQGLAADAAKAAGWALLEACEAGSLKGWSMWNFVHDEFLLEGPEDDAARAALEVQRIMQEAAQEWMPDVPVRASAALMRRWTKAAEPVYRDGQLIPWEDRQS